METEITDVDRARATLLIIMRAEMTLGLKDGREYPISERSQRILKAAQRQKLDPRLYGVAWFVRQMS